LYSDLSGEIIKPFFVRDDVEAEYGDECDGEGDDGGDDEYEDTDARDGT